jgi:hypothetical protein
LEIERRMLDVQHNRRIIRQKKHIVGKAPGKPLGRNGRLKTVRFGDGLQQICLGLGGIGSRAHLASVSWGNSDRYGHRV